MAVRTWKPITLWAALLAVGCSARIQHGLDERQANEIQTTLIQRGVAAQKVLEPGKKPTWAIEVDDDHASDAIRALAELGLPKPKTEGFGDIFGKGSLIPSPTEERALYVEALSGEVARTLESVDGVASARVHLVLPAPSSAGQPPLAAKAAALLRVRSALMERLGHQRPELRALIAGSVAGLSPDSVTLVLNEVSTSVDGHSEPSTRLGKLRGAVLAMGLLASLLAGVLATVAVKLRAYRSELRAFRAVASSPSKSGQVSLSLQGRKVA